MYVSRNNEARCCNHCCSGKAINIAYTECEFVALVIQYTMHMRHIVICDLSGLHHLYHTFSTLAHKRHDFRKILLNIKSILIFSTTMN